MEERQEEKPLYDTEVEYLNTRREIPFDLSKEENTLYSLNRDLQMDDIYRISKKSQRDEEDVEQTLCENEKKLGFGGI